MLRGRAFFYKNSEESIARQLSATFTQLKCWPQIWEARRVRQPCHVHCNACAKQENAGTVHMLARGGTAKGRQTFVLFTGYGVCQSASLLCTKYTWEAFGPLHYVLRRQTRNHLLCSGLSSSKNRQVRKSYTTNTMSFFLRIQKEQNPTVEPTWVRKHHLFFCLFFFFAFSPLHFFYSKSRLDLYKIRSGEKMPHRKKKKKCR